MKKKIETNEITGSDSSGAFSAPMNSTVIKKKNITKIHNSELSEITDSSSSGQYDVPFNGGKKDPLRIDGEKSIKNSRAVKDKNFPKWGGPGSIFVKIKDKCKKYPYCNQGDINALEIIKEMKLDNIILEVAKENKLNKKIVENFLIKEINQIFINKK